MTALSQPPSLRDFLDAGCDLAAVPGLNLRHLANMLEIADSTPAARARWARYYRETAAAWVAGEPSEMDEVSFIHQVHEQVDVCCYAWAADALESPALLAKVRWLR
jgi:hypothetical protein